MPKFTANKSTSQDFFDDLNSYMQDNVLGSNGEIVDENFKKLDIQLPHVGDFYDLKRDGNPFRVLIFGQDPKNPGIWDMRCKKKITQRYNNNKHSVAKSHMAGTLYTLQLLFGILLDKNNRELTTEKGKIGIYSAFALSNACLCKWEKDVRKNSLPHFKETIERLKPQIVILQGEEAAKSFNEAFCSDQEDKIRKDKVQIFKDIIDEPMLVLWLFHHSHIAQSYWPSNKVKDYYSCNIAKLLEEYEKCKESWD